MMAKTKEQIEDYIKSKKEYSILTFNDRGIEYIGFQDGKGYFRGRIKRDKYSINSVKKNLGQKVKIKIKQKGIRGKKRIVYTIYNKKQQKEILFRMNKKLRTPENKNKYKRYGFKVKEYEYDAVPISKDKKRIDLLFDKYKFEPVIIEKYEGESP